jgi:hypothetical protein
MAGPTHLAIAYPGAIPAGTGYGQKLDGREYGVPQGATLVPGAGAEIPFEELTCTMQKLDGSGPCSAPRLKDDDVCLAHRRTREKQQKRGS